ncbi:YHS domain-containing (seleno)protein [Changchengzhania lutea]|uniref:YHS domain-containing (seleno)protein n=1 Tax=Changchengzhania lutea TaxID=2049305 RepID=UPI00115E26A1|nr:YHS domain-containing (seleno)protein [Changchengzhania lutea]
MKTLFLLLTLSSSFLFAQTIDYNLKNGFIAHGYDVVAYFNNTAVKGENQFQTTYDGVKYKFSSEKHLNIFKQNPKKYVPQYGGYCAYAVAVKSDKVAINPKTFTITDGKLYLFYDAWGTNTLNLWDEENPTKLQSKADKNWDIIKLKK